MTRRYALLIVALVLATAFLGARAGSQQDNYTLRFGEHVFDPLERTPDLQFGWDRSDDTARDLHLVQLKGATRNETLGLIRGSGLEVVQYVYPNTYIVWGMRAERDTLLAHEDVRWTGDFAPASVTSRRHSAS